MVQVAVEIKDGCLTTFIEPIKVPGHRPHGQNQLIWLDAHRGVVTKTINFCNENIYLIEVPKHGEFRVVYWRIIEFTFGGVWMPHRKFDQLRIDNQVRRLSQP